MTFLLSVTVGQVFAKIGYILIALLVLMFMITIHELGHYTFGKLLKFKITEFSIGMGPKIFQKKHKTTEEKFSIRAIPLGGYCSFDGEDEEKLNSPDAFNNQKPWKRLIVLFGGVLFNFVSAILIAIIAFSCFGEYRLTTYTIYETSPNYDNNTIQLGDIILGINGKDIYFPADYTELIQESGDSASVTVFRPTDKTAPVTKISDKQGEILTLLNVKIYTYKIIGEDGKEKTYNDFGIRVKSSAERIVTPFFQSFGRGFVFCGKVGTVVLKTLGQLITGVIGIESVGGPITTIDMIASIVAVDFTSILFLIVLISVNLAVFNLLPLPALDGCRMIFVLIEWIRGKPINRKVESWIHAVGIILLLAFVIFIDVFKWF